MPVGPSLESAGRPRSARFPPLGEVGLRRRFILCDGAELARLWARIGSGESEELTWVPQDEEESRARPAGLPRPPGRASRASRS